MLKKAGICRQFLLCLNLVELLIKTPACAGVFIKFFINNYLTVVVALRFHFQTSSPEP